jgi:hypothetical protein
VDKLSTVVHAFLSTRDCGQPKGEGKEEEGGRKGEGKEEEGGGGRGRERDWRKRGGRGREEGRERGDQFWSVFAQGGFEKQKGEAESNTRPLIVK